MALPTTISGVLATLGWGVPYKSSGGNIYVILRDSTSADKIRAFKATDPTSSFSNVGTDVTLTSNKDLRAMAVHQDGDNLHVATVSYDADTSADIRYHVFSMSSDSWTTSNEAVGTNTAINLAVPGGPRIGIGIMVRSDGDIITIHPAAVVANMGSDRARVSYSRKEGSTWTTVALDNGGANNWAPMGLVAGSSDRSHFFFANVGTSEGFQRALTSANSLQAFPSAFTTVAFVPSDGRGNAQGVSYVSGANTKVRQPYEELNQGWRRAEFDSADAPTPTNGAIINDTAGDVTDQGGFPQCALAADGTDLYALFIKGADLDLYRDKNADGAGWGTDAKEFTGTVNSVGANVYARSGTKLAYVIDDGGTVKYNEFAISGGFTEATASASGTGTATGTGASTAASTASATGTGTASGVGASTAAATASAAGTGAATAVGTDVKPATGSATGTGDATATGASTAAATAAASATGSATATGASTAASAAAASGTGAATGVGASTAAGTAAASGAGAATAVGTGINSATASASGTGAATATGVAITIAAGDGSAAGTGVASAVGASTAASTAAAAGTGVATGGGASTAAATASASATGAASAVGTGINAATASAAGTGAASVEGVALSIAAGDGSAAGTGAASAVGASTAAATASTTGTGAAVGVGSATASATASAAGTGAAAAVGVGLVPGVAATAGTGTATGIGAAIASGVGSAVGTSTAGGIGAATWASTASAAALGIASGIGFAVTSGDALPPIQPFMLKFRARGPSDAAVARVGGDTSLPRGPSRGATVRTPSKRARPRGPTDHSEPR